jgi:hypothetical protein
MTLARKDATAKSAQRSKTRDENPSLKRPYRKPQVRPAGKVAQTIMSPSPGTFESGSGGGFKG